MMPGMPSSLNLANQTSSSATSTGGNAMLGNYSGGVKDETLMLAVGLLVFGIVVYAMVKGK